MASGLYPLKFEWADNFFKGAAVVKKNGKSGVVDAEGNFIIQPVFESIRLFKGFASAKKDGKWGSINRKGNWAIPPEFNLEIRFLDNFAVVDKDDQAGIIDKKGNFIIKPHYLILELGNTL
jgi:hypothetical protein